MRSTIDLESSRLTPVGVFGPQHLYHALILTSECAITMPHKAVKRCVCLECGQGHIPVHLRYARGSSIYP